MYSSCNTQTQKELQERRLSAAFSSSSSSSSFGRDEEEPSSSATRRRNCSNPQLVLPPLLLLLRRDKRTHKTCFVVVVAVVVVVVVLCGPIHYFPVLVRMVAECGSFQKMRLMQGPEKAVTGPFSTFVAAFLVPQRNHSRGLRCRVHSSTARQAGSRSSLLVKLVAGFVAVWYLCGEAFLWCCVMLQCVIFCVVVPSGVVLWRCWLVELLVVLVFLCGILAAVVVCYELLAVFRVSCSVFESCLVWCLSLVKSSCGCPLSVWSVCLCCVLLLWAFPQCTRAGACFPSVVVGGTRTQRCREAPQDGVMFGCSFV